MIVASFRRI